MKVRPRPINPEFPTARMLSPVFRNSLFEHYQSDQARKPKVAQARKIALTPLMIKERNALRKKSARKRQRRKMATIARRVCRA